MLKKLKSLVLKGMVKRLEKKTAEGIGVLNIDGLQDAMYALPSESGPGTIPDRVLFRKGDVVRLSHEGLTYLSKKILSRTKNAALLTLLSKPLGVGIVIDTLPALHWSAWDGDSQIGSGPSDVGDVILAVPASREGLGTKISGWESVMKYSGYLEKVPDDEIPSAVTGAQYPYFPQQNQFFPGDSVVISQESRNNPFCTYKWPSRASGAGKIVDVFPVQYSFVGDGSMDSYVRPFDCVVSVFIPEANRSLMFHHYSGWLEPA